MFIKTYILLIFSVNNVIVRGQSADQKSRFAFVIDDTYSMSRDIEEVKSKTKLIFDTVRTSAESHIENFILVTFNDPGFQPALVTNSESVFKKALDAIVVHSGPDNLECPEMSMHGLAEALAHTLPGSYIYVFTDAAAKDYADGPKIKKLAQKQGTQISFILTPPTCGAFYENDPNYKVYKDLAAATSGQILHVARGEVGQVLDFVGRSLDKRRAVIGRAELPPGYNNNITISGDKELGDVQFSVTGLRPKLKITKPDGNEANTTDIFKNDKTLVVGVDGLESGNHTANVGSETDTSVVITGVTNVNFQHGFSEFKPRSINTTITRPILGKPSHLAIELSSKAKDFKLDEVELLDMNDNVISVWPLKELTTNFYVAEKQMPPTTMFRVAVKGHNTKTNEYIRRLSATPVEPQTLTTDDKPENRRPTVTLVGDSSIAVAYGDSVQLQCKINAYPKPKLTWIEEISGLTVSEMIVEEDLPYGYISILDLEQVKSNTSYQCRAFNDYGDDTTKVSVGVNSKVPPKINNSVKQINVTRKESATITCNVTEGIPRPEIRWSYKRPLTREFVLLDDVSYVIQINSTDLHQAGTYKCEASNLFGRDEHEMELIIKYPPTIRGNTQIRKASKGQRVFLTCNADGVPKPDVRWYFKGHEIGKTSGLRIYTGNTLSMVVSFNDSGIYTCNAVNEVGSDTKTVKVVVDGPPFIEKSSVPKTTTAVVGDLVMNLPCLATGSPQPMITWAKDGVEISSGTEWYNINKDGTLVINNVTETSQGRYVCTARNSKGTDTDYFEVVVRPYPDPTEKRNVVNLLLGSSATIDCDVPHTTSDRLIWYKGAEIVATGELHLKDVDIDSSGMYTCRVSTLSGAASATTVLNVGFPPEFLEQSSEQTEFVLNEEAYFSCLAAGEPNPTAKWLYNGKELDVTDMDYRVYMTFNDLGNYRCTVSNIYGTITRDFQIVDPGCTLLNGINNDSPQVSLINLRLLSDNMSSVKVPKGEGMTIICGNGFEQYSGTELEAVCVEATTLRIHDVEVNFSHVKCKKQRKPN
ncbi:PREDICTED: hemicentin-1 [Papilio xuthus]|uniref:Hemicentin-1 n=1 Tax=Papilio xuthus TaxID=66420 RepID=A0AAJ7ECC6_PAPXU|nr:PREDICTED: hemicentin-1 [Papilio xuthus]